MSTEVRHVPERDRYEALVDGTLAGRAEYRREDDSVVFLHTVVDPAHEGQGVGSALVRGALDDVRAAGLSAVPVCSFVANWVDTHPDYQDLLAQR